MLATTANNGGKAMAGNKFFEVYPNSFVLYRRGRVAGNYPIYKGFRDMLEKMAIQNVKHQNCPLLLN